jgi:hypothetical protein
MFQLLKFGARDELAYLAGTMGLLAYQDHIWALRYPGPAPKSTGAWPFRKAAEAQKAASNVRALSGAKRP